MILENCNENKTKKEETSHIRKSEYASEMKFHTARAFDIFNYIKYTMAMCTTTLMQFFCILFAGLLLVEIRPGGVEALTKQRVGVIPDCKADIPLREGKI